MMLDTTVNGFAALYAVLFVLLTTTTVLRFVARFKQQAKTGPDDWLMVFAWLMFTGLTTIAIFGMANHYMGYKQPTNPAAVALALPTMAKLYFSLDMLGIIGIATIRLSAIFFYRRIFCTKHRADHFKRLTTFMIGVTIVWAISWVLLDVFQCGLNVSSIWLQPRTCASVTYPFLVGWAIGSFIQDVLVFVLPLPKIWSLHTTTRRKISICVVFLLALAGLGASCARMVIFIGLWKNGPVKNSLDIYQSNTQSAYYTSLEVGLCGVAVNLPSLWYFHSNVKPEKFLQSMRSFVSMRSSSSTSSKLSRENEKPSVVNVTTEYSVQSEDRHELGLPSKRHELETKTHSELQ